VFFRNTRSCNQNPLSSFLQSSTPQALDCSLGCETTEDPIEKTAVCGMDRFGVLRTFQNKCLALCQEVKLDSTLPPGPCRGDKGASFFPQRGLIRAEDMKRFSSEGFLLVGWAVRGEFDPAASFNSDEKAPTTPSEPPRDQLIEAKRFTPDGLLFVARVVEPRVDTTINGFAPTATTKISNDINLPAKPASTSRMARLARKMLAIIGADDRQQIGFQAAYPYSAIGQVFFNKASGGNFICSGAMISRRAYMTSAHCVYERTTSKWQQNWRFAPAQYVNGAGVQRVGLGGTV
jgi:V8-like Glu-specific endopeptidase